MALFSNVFRLTALDLEQRRVFVRADLDVPLSSFGGVLDDALLRAALPTVRQLLAAGATVVLGAHYGDPQQPAASNAARCVARRLGELLGREVALLSRDFASELTALQRGDVALTPNLIEYPEELANDPAFAQQLARSIDAYVGDDVRAARQTWASVDALPRILQTRGSGLILGGDLDMLELLADPSPLRPYVAVVGGDSFSRKAKLLWAVLGRVDALLLGGVVANTCLVAQGWHPGLSTYEAQELDAARALLAAAREHGVAVHLPQDAKVMRPELGLSSLEERAINALGPHEAVVDVGLETYLTYREVLCMAATVVWNGQMGAATDDALRGGTCRIAQAITTSAPRTMVFGKRTVALADLLDVLKPFQHVSRSGEGALPLLSGTVLPGIESLRSLSLG